MNRQQSPRRGPSRLAFLWAVGEIGLAVLAGLLPGIAAGQGGKDQLRVLLSYDLKQPGGIVRVIELRPNTEQGVYLHLQNPTQDARRNVLVRLMKVEDDGVTATEIGRTTVAVLPGGKSERLSFKGGGAPADKPAPAPKPVPPAEKPAPAPAPAWPELGEPPFQLQVWVEEKEGMPVKTTLPVRIRHPREYTDVVAAEQDPVKKSLTIEIGALENFNGNPPSIVRMVLPPAFNPGLIPPKASAVYRQVLRQPKQRVVLAANNITFAGPVPKSGRVYVDVDDYDRAFMYRNSYTEGTLQTLPGTRVRLFVPRYAVPGAKVAMEVQVDNPPAEGILVEVGMDRAGTGRFDTIHKRGFREQHIYYQVAGPDGGLRLKSTIRDWSVPLDTVEVYGERELRVRLFRLEEGNKKAEMPIAIVNEAREVLEPLALFNEKLPGPWASLRYEQDAVKATLVLDGTPPANVTFEELPKQHVRGKPLVLKARAEEDLSSFSSVVFFTGKPLPDGKLPPTPPPVEGVPVPSARDLWSAELPVPADLKGPLEVSVRFTNAAGLSTTEAAVIELVDPKAASKSKVTTTIKGKVVEGRFAIPKLEVTLTDVKAGKAVAKAVTNAKGEFVFENVPPGNYQVSAARSPSRTRGAATVEVPEGTELIENVVIKLFR